MRYNMHRGKQQVLFNYLPGRTFDYQGGVIAIVKNILGTERPNLNKRMILKRIQEDIQGWPDDRKYRSSLTNEVLRDPNRFVLLDPTEVQSSLFPKVFICSNPRCGKIYDYSKSMYSPNKSCTKCQSKVEQIRFINVHRCGHIEPLTPPFCKKCNTSQHFSLDTKDSERIFQFRWICNKCGQRTSLYSTYCKECDWDGSNEMKRMEVEPHRARKTYYSHSTIVLNLPIKEFESFLNNKGWEIVIAARYLGLDDLKGIRLLDYFKNSGRKAHDFPYDEEELVKLLEDSEKAGLTKSEIVKKLTESLENESPKSKDIEHLLKQVESFSGVKEEIWMSSGNDLLEIMMPLEGGDYQKLSEASGSIFKGSKAKKLSEDLGLSEITLLNDFPIVSTTYGFTRSEFAPRKHGNEKEIRNRINSFPVREDGKIPLYIDDVQADAIVFQLNHDVIFEWIERNGFKIDVPRGKDLSFSRKAFFVQLFNNSRLKETIRGNDPILRMTFGLLHTFSHMAVKKAALLSGLDRTSLSEYLIPNALSFVIYCNHRFGATIGALTTLFENSLSEWLESILEARSCVYDPVCREHEGSCHACAQLAETSCRFFNLNLGRAFLFGGNDIELGDIKEGFLTFLQEAKYR